MSEKDDTNVVALYKLDGVKDIKPMKARGNFAKALAEENRHGHTTPEAERLLQEAIAAEDFFQSLK